MRHSAQKSYQYPVLRTNSEDYINESFAAEIDVEFNAVSVNISIKYILSSEEIKREIFNRKASYISVITCKDTFYSHSIRSNHKSDSIEINAGDLRGNVEIQSFVIAEKNVVIKSQNLNADYNMFQSAILNESNDQFNQFTYDKGDMLALTDSYLFAIDREYFKPLQSCIDIDDDPELKGGDWRIDTSENHLKIVVSKEMKQIWSSLSQQEAGKAALFNSLYFTAISYAIQVLRAEPDIVNTNKWAEVITAKINNLGINIEEEDYRVTTKLLNEPLLSLNNITYEY